MRYHSEVSRHFICQCIWGHTPTPHQMPSVSLTLLISSRMINWTQGELRCDQVPRKLTAHVLCGHPERPFYKQHASVSGCSNMKLQKSLSHEIAKISLSPFDGRDYIIYELEYFSLNMHLISELSPYLPPPLFSPNTHAQGIAVTILKIL